MITLAPVNSSMKRIKHHGLNIIEFAPAGKNYEASEALIHEFVASLKKMRAGKKIKLLVNLEGSTYDPRMILIWKSQLPLFNEKIERSAVIGVSGLAAAAIQGLSFTASLAGLPFKGRRAVIFGSRDEAVDFLIRP